MLKKRSKLMATVFALSISHSVQAGWLDILNAGLDETTKKQGLKIASSALSNNEVVSGLKEALAKGVESAINTLGQPGGFLGNKIIEIAVPDSLNTVAVAARNFGQGTYVDSFETSMNQAAEKAVPEAAKILADAIRQMSVDDAMAILNGSDDAATQYFRQVSGEALSEKFRPIVDQATDQVGVTAAYKALTAQAMPMLGTIMDSSSLDLEQYVTNKSLDGLFKYIAMEEKRIRDNPAARTSDLLKKVFGG